MTTSTSSARVSGEVNFKEFSCWECKKSPENSEYMKTLVLHGFPTSPPIFECPQCYLHKQDPLCPVVSWIVQPRVLTSNQVYNGKIEEKDRKLLAEGKGLVQVRCMKLDSRTKYMMRFPDKCQVSIAGVKVKAFQPLEQSISTKFRRDEKVDFEHPLLQKTDNIAFSISYENVYDDNGKNTLRSDKPIYIFAVAVVRKSSPKDVLELITKDHSIGQEQFNRIVQCNFELGDQSERNLQLEEVKVVNRCPITHKKIIYPGRVASAHTGLLVHASAAVLPAEPLVGDRAERGEELDLPHLQSAVPPPALRQLHEKSVRRHICPRQRHLLLQRKRLILLRSARPPEAEASRAPERAFPDFSGRSGVGRRGYKHHEL